MKETVDPTRFNGVLGSNSAASDTRKRTVIVICRLDESLRDKVAAIKAERYGGITSVVEKAIRRYKLKGDK